MHFLDNYCIYTYTCFNILKAAGKSTGVVSTARITHASPAGAYANIANRNWENDHEVKRDTNNPDECDDIAEQLILRDPGRNINVK